MISNQNNHKQRSTSQSSTQLLPPPSYCLPTKQNSHISQNKINIIKRQLTGKFTFHNEQPRDNKDKYSHSVRAAAPLNKTIFRFDESVDKFPFLHCWKCERCLWATTDVIMYIISYLLAVVSHITYNLHCQHFYCFPALESETEKQHIKWTST